MSKDTPKKNFMNSSNNKISAILLNWKRSENIPIIISHLLRYKFIDEIIIADNSKGENLKVYARYLAAQRAKNELIYFQDDDCLIDVEKVYNAYDGRAITAVKEDTIKTYPERIS